jgi:hypothetical protein
MLAHWNNSLQLDMLLLLSYQAAAVDQYEHVYVL